MLLGLAAWLFQSHPGWVLGIGAVIVLGAFLVRGKSCDFCGSPIKRVANSWRIDGVKKTACPECSRRLQREASKQGVDSVIGRKG